MHFENKFMILIKYAEKATTIFHFWGAASVNFVPSVRDHPFKTSACSRGGGVKNLSNLPTDSTKKMPTVGG